jgi:hypothetical protein
MDETNMEFNDIPEGMARIEAMDCAIKTATPGEDVRQILGRAALYYAFLTTNRPAIMAAAEEHKGAVN